jgi:hypothetical protein
MPVLSALTDGYEVYFLTDASGERSKQDRLKRSKRRQA